MDVDEKKEAPGSDPEKTGSQPSDNARYAVPENVTTSPNVDRIEKETETVNTPSSDAGFTISQDFGLPPHLGIPTSVPHSNANSIRSQDIRPASAANRPIYSAGNATVTGSVGGRSLPPLKREETRLAQKEAHPWQHLGITLGLPMIIIFDIVVPCIIYYS